MKTLFMTVGTGRNRDDIARGLFYGIEYHQPDLIYFFCSQKTASETMPQIMKLLDGKFEYRQMIFQKEDDVQYLFNAYNEEISKTSQADEIIVDFTSGTKAMSAAMFSAGIAAGANFVSYIVGQRDETGRVTTSSGVQSIEPAAVIAYHEVEKARTLFNEGDYVAAEKLASSVKKYLSSKTMASYQADVICRLAGAYSLWERFKWKQAANELKGSLRGSGAQYFNTAQKETIKSSVEFLNAVADNDYGYERLVDLEQSAVRCQQKKHYDDALCRLYRAVEYFNQVILKNEFQLDTSEATIEEFEMLFGIHKFDDKLKDKLRSKAKYPPYGKVKPGLAESIEILASMQNHAGQYLARAYWGENWHTNIYQKKITGDKLQNWLRERNTSYLAHGTKPVEETTLKNLLTFYNELLDRFGKGDITAMRQAAKFIKL